MNLLFYAAAALALVTTALAITRVNPVYGLLNFIVSLLAMGVVFYTLGAPFAAALEVIVYAGAIMVLFLFVVMMLGLDAAAARREQSWLTGGVWRLPVLVVGLLGVELALVLGRHGDAGHGAAGQGAAVAAQAVGARLFTRDLPAVELASMLLLAALIGAYHLGRPRQAGKR